MSSAAPAHTGAGAGRGPQPVRAPRSTQPLRAPDRVLAQLTGTPTRVVGAGLCLVVAAVLFRAWVVLPAWFFLDDYVYLDDARDEPFGLSWLLEPYNGHFMPGARLLISAVAGAGPVNWGVAATTTLGLQAVAGLAALWSLVRLFGPRPGVLVPLAVYLSTVITVPGLVWWAAAINLVPVQIALTCAVTCWVEALRTRAPRWLALTVLSVVVGLCFDVRAVLTLPVLAFLAAAYFARGGPGRRLGEVVGRWWRGLGVLVVVGAAYSWFYLSQVDQVTSRPRWTDVRDLAADVFGRTLPTGTVGGPWRWFDPSPPTALADPPSALVAVAWVVVVGVVGWVALRRRRTLRAWMPLLGYSAALVYLVASTRSSAAEVAGLEYRFLTEAGFLLALGLALATMTLPGAVESSEARERAAVPPAPYALVAAGTVAVVVGGVWSTAAYAREWHTRNASQPYVARLSADLAAEGPVDIAELRTRERVLSALVFPRNNTRTLIAPLSDDARFPPVSGDLHVVADDGSLAAAVVDPATRSQVGPVPGCGWLAEASELTVPLEDEAEEELQWLRVGYLLGSDTRATLVAGEVSTEVDLEAGLNSVFVRHNGGFDTVSLTGLPPDAGLCVDVVEVGGLLPAGLR